MQKGGGGDECYCRGDEISFLLASVIFCIIRASEKRVEKENCEKIFFTQVESGEDLGEALFKSYFKRVFC